MKSQCFHTNKHIKFVTSAYILYNRLQINYELVHVTHGYSSGQEIRIHQQSYMQITRSHLRKCVVGSSDRRGCTAGRFATGTRRVPRAGRWRCDLPILSCHRSRRRKRRPRRPTAPATASSSSFMSAEISRFPFQHWFTPTSESFVRHRLAFYAIILWE